MLETTGEAAPIEAQQPATTTEPVEPKSPETHAEGEEKKEAEAESKPRVFTQAELDEILRKEKAKAEAKAERRVLRTLEKFQGQQPAPVRQVERVDDKPTRSQYADEEAYFEALTDWKLERRDRAQRQEQAQQATRSITDKTESIYAQAAKIDGFDRDEFEALPLTPVIAQAIVESDAAPKLMAWMSANADEVERIARLSPARQAAEIGKLEERVSKAPVRTTSAPDPIKGVNGQNATVKNLESMSLAEYKKYREGQGARWARRR